MSNRTARLVGDMAASILYEQDLVVLGEADIPTRRIMLPGLNI